MLRYLKLLILIPVGVAIVGIAVINRMPVKLVYWPEQLGGELTITLPVFAALMSAMMLGVILGSIATWLAQGSHRRAERRYRREAERLKNDAERLKSMQPTLGDLALPALKSNL